MTRILDSRPNSGGKSLGNRERFIKKSKDAIKKAVDHAINTKQIKELSSDEGHTITIPGDGIHEPIFGNNSGKGNKERILHGNTDYIPGDIIEKPMGGQGQGSNGPGDPGDSTDGQDEFAFTLTKEEFLEFFFDDLELPNLVKTNLKEVKILKYSRAGVTTSGSPANLNIERTFKQSLARRYALHRPTDLEIEELESQLALLKEEKADESKILELEILIDKKRKKQKTIPWMDPIDLRYNLFTPNPKPNAKAVMFCLMDVSASMSEYEKNIAKRFYFLLYTFLTKKYEHIDIVFIRHHTEAKEVNEEDFFYSQESGGTTVSSCIELSLEIIKERYNSSEYNLYFLQASDGDNTYSDNDKCFDLLSNHLMKLVQYYAYIEIAHENGNSFDMFSVHRPNTLWGTYERIKNEWQNFVMKGVGHQRDIWPVFKDLFEKK